MINGVEQLADGLPPLAAFVLLDQFSRNLDWVSKLNDSPGPEFVGMEVVHAARYDLESRVWILR